VGLERVERVGAKGPTPRPRDPIGSKHAVCAGSIFLRGRPRVSVTGRAGVRPRTTAPRRTVGGSNVRRARSARGGKPAI
jgi:hypothetical protein